MEVETVVGYASIQIPGQVFPPVVRKLNNAKREIISGLSTYVAVGD